MDVINRLPEFFRQKRSDPKLQMIASLIEPIPQPVIICSLPDGNIRSTNPAFAQLSGLSSAALYEQPITDFLPEFVNQANKLAASSGKRAYEFAATVPRKDTAPVKVKTISKKISDDPILILNQIEKLSSSSTTDLDEYSISEYVQNLSQQTSLRDTLLIVREYLWSDTITVYQTTDRKTLHKTELIRGDDDELPQKLRLPVPVPLIDKLLLSTDGEAWFAPQDINPRETEFLGIYHLGTLADKEFFLILGDIAPGMQNIDLKLKIGKAFLNPYLRNGNGLLAMRNSQQLETIESPVCAYINDGLVLLSEFGIIIDVNAAAESILGYSKADASGKKFGSLVKIPDFALPALEDFHSPEIDAGVVYLDKRSGTTIPVQLRFLLMETVHERAQICLIMTDISENEEYRIKAKQYEQRAWLGDISTMFAHEVKNPINNIHLTSNVLKLKLKGTELEEKTENIQADCRRLSKLMDSILSFSKHRVYNIKPIHLSEIINPVADRFRPRMARKNVEFSLVLPESLPKILGDKNSLEQVFINLITNAIQAMEPEGGAITIKARTLDNQVSVTISDTGPGIPEDIALNIFNPFFSTKKDGIGIGLTITKNIISAHDGSIDVESVPGGTIFRIILPSQKKL